MTEETGSQPSSEPGTRKLRPVIPASDYALRDRWAIVVGISRYQNERWNLKYAHRDAEMFYDLIRKPSGGGFLEDHVVKLIDEEATTRSVTRALRGFLQKPAKEDVVLLYFACHGAPDPNRPENVYVITHDTDPKDIPGTALPMREIHLSLQENLAAERTIIIMDACHSGVIGEGRRAADETASVNRYLQSLGDMQAGLGLLTSARSNETSQEDARWGDGHGVFTYYLLEGMRGEADRNPKNGIVTVGELFEYVREEVRKATGHQQHPFTGPGPVFDWPMAWTGGRSAQEHLQLGQSLFELGTLTDDKSVFDSAGRQFAEALHFARLDGVALPEANLGRGRALLAAGRNVEALAELDKAIAGDAEGAHVRANFYRGVAFAREGDRQEAAAELEAFSAGAPGDEFAPWAEEYSAWLRQIGGGKRTALLIGVNTYARAKPLSDLRGCVNDVEQLSAVLQARFGFDKAGITRLTDARATYQGIVEALEHLVETATPYDSVLVFFSGHSRPGDSPHYLIVHDTVIESSEAYRDHKFKLAIGAQELHDLMNRIPTKHKTLILDTHPNLRFLDLARREGNYALFVASSEERVFEHTLELDGERIQMGVFTWSLVGQLMALDARTTYHDLVYPVREVVQKHQPQQTPEFIGRRERRVFAEADDYLGALDFALRRSYGAFALEDVRARYARYCQQVDGSMPALHESFGRAFLEKEVYGQAVEALQTCIDQRGTASPVEGLVLGLALVGACRYADALPYLAAFAKAAPESADLVSKATGIVEALQAGRKAALLVGIDNYASPDIPPLLGARNDVAALRETLLERFGLRPDEVVVLLDGDATRQGILEAFEQLVECARNVPSFFYFAGRGSADDEDRPALVSADGRQPGVYDILLEELAHRIPQESNLVTILDAGWQCNGGAEGRSLARDRRARSDGRDISFVPTIVERDARKYRVPLGRASIYEGSVTFSHYKASGEILGPQGSALEGVHGVMTAALVSALSEAGSESLSVAQLSEAMSAGFDDDRLIPMVLGEATNAPLFDPEPNHQTIYVLAARAEHQPVRKTAERLRILIERNGDVYPEGYLNLGIAYAFLGEHDRAIAALEKAIVQQDPYPEAHYYLGRTLVEAGRDAARAVSELREAIEQEEPGNANVATRYYLGRALRAFVEQDILVEAEGAYRDYLAGGAPLGHEAEVQEFLEHRYDTV